MKTTHGPWFARDNGHFWEVVVSPDEFARSVADVPVTARQSNEESEKIARLLAMAPDLLAERDRLKALNAELAEALEDLTDIIENAGLLNLVNGVQLGQTSWYVKASDRMQHARVALAKNKGETE